MCTYLVILPLTKAEKIYEAVKFINRPPEMIFYVKNGIGYFYHPSQDQLNAYISKIIKKVEEFSQEDKF